MENTLLTDLNTRTSEIYTSTQNIENLLVQQNQINGAQYASSLFIVGVVCALFVCVLLYKFIKLFY